MARVTSYWGWGKHHPQTDILSNSPHRDLSEKTSAVLLNGSRDFLIDIWRNWLIENRRSAVDWCLLQRYLLYFIQRLVGIGNSIFYCLDGYPRDDLHS